MFKIQKDTLQKSHISKVIYILIILNYYKNKCLHLIIFNIYLQLYLLINLYYIFICILVFIKIFFHKYL